MLRSSGRRLSPFLWRPTSAGFSLFSDDTIATGAPSNHDSKSAADAPAARFSLESFLPGRIRGFSSESLVSRHQDLGLGDLPATVLAIKNTSSKIIYDEHNHERYPPGDPTKRAFAYFYDEHNSVLTMMSLGEFGKAQLPLTLRYHGTPFWKRIGFSLVEICCPLRLSSILCLPVKLCGLDVLLARIASWFSNNSDLIYGIYFAAVMRTEHHYS